MLRRLRSALSPGWLLLQVIALGLVVVMVLLGRWQLEVSNAKHFNLQNFGYALQWWAFSLFVLGMWARILLDTGGRTGGRTAGRSVASPSQHPEPAGPAGAVAYRRYVMPQGSAAAGVPADAERAAYNAYLAGLERESAARNDTEGAAP